MKKKIKEWIGKAYGFCIEEHWGISMSILFFAFITTLGIIAFHPSGEKARETVFYIILVCALIVITLFPVVLTIWPILKDSHKENTLKVLITLFAVLFFISSLILSQSVFVKKTEYSADVPYEVADTVCYITDTGDCYHKSWCHYLISQTQISVSSAKAQGYRPCSYCWDDNTTRYRKETLEKVDHNYFLAYAISFLLFAGLSAVIIMRYKRIEKRESNIIENEQKP